MIAQQMMSQGDKNEDKKLSKEELGALGEGNVKLSGPMLPRDRTEQREKWGGRAKAGAEF